MMNPVLAMLLAGTATYSMEPAAVQISGVMNV